MLKVLLFTSQDIGNEVFAYLHAHSDVELRVVTQRTRRDEIYGYRPTAELCAAANVPCYMPKAFDEAFLQEIAAFAPDIAICAYYPRIFPPALLRIPRLGCVNLHPGLLPDYRGTFPTAWCILNEEIDIGITVHFMDATIDTGDIIAQRRHKIGDDETGHELYRRSMKLCADLFIDTFDSIVRGTIERKPQAPGGSYYNRIEPQYRIDWHLPRRQLRNQIRVHAKPYFPAYSFIYNKCVLINRVSLCDSADYKAQGAGIIQSVDGDGRFIVSCVDGCLCVEEYDLMPILRDDDRALHIRAGNRFSTRK
jgi:methionyl-tRNA formyltransferase